MSKILQLIPLAIELARIAEAAVPLPGQGNAKLAFAVELAGSIFETQEDLRSSWSDKSDFLDAFNRAIFTAVRLLNMAGVFKK
jgi:photosystem II stability/assembly factor-like uncharacterized protein